jgi:6-phosphogluconolactonase
LRRVPLAPPPSSSAPELAVAGGLAELIQTVADRIRRAAADAIAARGRFRIALAGGSTPRALYPALVTGVDWSRTQVLFGDERAVPPDDAQSNYRMARETLLDPAGVPAANVVRWRSEDSDLDAAARDYEAALTASGQPPWLDLALLGLGPDGHTASLFPGTTALSEARRLAAPVFVSTLGVWRLTLTYPVLLEARDVFFLVTGREKAAALAGVRRNDPALPASRLAHRSGPVAIFCDRDAFQNDG